MHSAVTVILADVVCGADTTNIGPHTRSQSYSA
jgi:hypothetical protein